jgi:hypothetical protein
MRTTATDLARHLAQNAEAVCRHHLSNGRRVGRYWIVGDVRNTPGRSMYVRLFGPESGKGAAGKWTDAANPGEHGDLLDVIREACGSLEFRDVADEARRFLSLPRAEPEPRPKSWTARAPTGSPEAARRLFAAAQPTAGTLAETYLRHRGIIGLSDVTALRFHPRCYYRVGDNGPTEKRPAMIACVTDLAGSITGVQRTWLDLSGRGKAPVETPRRAMGLLLGNAVRFGLADTVMAAGEGIETVLSLRMVLPTMPMLAALSAAHLSAILFPDTLRRLYIARDADAAGSVSGRFLLIPQGSRLIGKYDNIVAFGQERALVVWQRIILPDGSSIVIDNLPATDTGGYAGLADEVDLHTWKLLKGIALATVMGVGSELAFGSSDNDLVKALQQSTQSTTNRAGQRLVERNLNVQPTITVRPGWPLRVLVQKDIVLRAYRGMASK